VHIAGELQSGSLKLTLSPGCILLLDRNKRAIDCYRAERGPRVSLETHQANVDKLVTLLRSLTHLKLESTPSESSTHWPRPRPSLSSSGSSNDLPRSGSLSASASSGQLSSAALPASSSASTITSLSLQGGGSAAADDMSYSLSLFPSLRTLEIKKCEASQIRGLSLLRPRLEKLVVRECGCELRELLASCMADACTDHAPWGELKFLRYFVTLNRLCYWHIACPHLIFHHIVCVLMMLNYVMNH
jgi:hypothetical protein